MAAHIVSSEIEKDNTISKNYELNIDRALKKKLKKCESVEVDYDD